MHETVSGICTERISGPTNAMGPIFVMGFPWYSAGTTMSSQPSGSAYGSRFAGNPSFSETSWHFISSAWSPHTENTNAFMLSPSDFIPGFTNTQIRTLFHALPASKVPAISLNVPIRKFIPKIYSPKSPWKQLQGDSSRKHSGSTQTARNTLRTVPYSKVRHRPLRLTLSAKHRYVNRTFKTRVQNHFHGLPVLRNGEMSENDKKTKKVLKRSQAQKVFRTKGSNQNDAGTNVLKIKKAKPIKVKKKRSQNTSKLSVGTLLKQRAEKFPSIFI